MPCSWHGVSCSNGGVSKIELVGNQLTGTIPNFNALLKLEKLYISDNNQLCKDKKINSFPDCPTLKPETHSLSTSSGNGGSISRSPDKENYNSGETVKLTAKPNQGRNAIQSSSRSL
jgi:hypothetical protein